MRRYWQLAVLLVLVLPAQGWAITVNVVTSGHTNGLGAASLTISATVAGGSDTNLYVCVADDKGDQGAVDIVTWNGSESLTKLTEHDAADIFGASLWRLKAPSTGTHDVVITPTVSTHMAAVVFALNGVNQTTSERTASTDQVTDSSATGTTVTVVNSQNGDFVVDCVGRRQLEDDVMTVGAGQTELAQSRANGFNDVGVLASYKAATGSNTVMTWTYSRSDLSYGVIGTPIVPESGGGGGPVIPKNLMLLGVGQ